MAIPNGRVVMSNSLSPSTLSPNGYSPTKGTPQSMTSSTLDDASLDELDRIMDTLSTLSRGTTMNGNGNPSKGYNGPSPMNSDQRSYPTTGSESTTPFSATSPIRGFPVTSPVALPPPMTSPPQTPVAPSPRHYSSNPKIMTMSVVPSHQSQGMSGLNEARNPATVPRLPSNPYENTSILHGSHMMRPSNFSSSDYASFPQISIPDSPYVNKNSSNENTGQYFFGPLPVSPQQNQPGRFPPTGPKPVSMLPHSSSDYSQNQNRNNREDFAPVGSNAQSSSRAKSNHNQTHESMTLPAYNEKRSYLKNLEEGTLPRPRIESARQESPQTTTPQMSRKLSKPKPSLGEEAANSLNRLSLRRLSNNKNVRRPAGKFGLQNMSKTPSRHSTTSFNSFDLGRGYASVSTAPASTHGLIQHEILPHSRNKGGALSPLAIESTSTERNVEDEHCCIRCGRFLYSHMLELFILIAFCAGFPVGIVLQATGFHSSTSFEKYYTFWGSTMLPAVLSTITPMLIVSSMLTGMSNLTPSVLKKLTAVSAIFYIISTSAAVLIAVGFSLLIKPGLPIAILSTNLTSIENASIANNIKWPALDILLQNGFLKDDGLSVYSINEENLFYNTSEVKDVTAADEILTLISLFFPGYGRPVHQQSSTGFCNVFVLAFFAGIIGVGASVMGAEGGPIRHVVSQIGTVMSNMADILLWYLPIGILFYVSEITATRIDWENIGQDRKSPDENFGANITFDNNYVISINDATTWYFFTVVSSLGLYCLVLMPLAISLITFSNPFSLLGFRSTAPLITALTVGFSDLCIPVTVRCLIKRRRSSRCCSPQEKIDRRVSRVSSAMGGIFHRGGSAIIIVCSTMYLLQIGQQQINIFGVIVICFSALITSVTSLGGRWFTGTDPFLRATVIGMSTSGLTSPSTIPTTLFTMWLVSRLAAFADTIIDLLGAHLIQRACRSGIKEISNIQDDTKGGGSTDSSNIDNKVCEMTNSVNKMPPVRTNSGETSDYEDAPLLFSRADNAGNESSSVNSRNDDSVFLPNRPHDTKTMADTGSTNHTIALQQRQAALANHGLHSAESTNQNLTNLARDQRATNSKGVSNPAISNKDEVSFVTF